MADEKSWHDPATGKPVGEPMDEQSRRRVRYFGDEVLEYVSETPDLAYATPGSAGVDVFAVEDVRLWPLIPRKVRLGLKVEIPPGYVGLMRGRSGLAFRSNVWCFDGTIDSDYRGEVSALLVLWGGWMQQIKAGERVAQLLFLKCVRLPLVRTDRLSPTARGENGYGSTGR